jgi:hypothetical protein
MNNFTYQYPKPYKLGPFNRQSICTDDMHPYRYVVQTQQQQQSLEIVDIVTKPYTINYMYKCVYAEATKNFNENQFPVSTANMPTTCPTPSTVLQLRLQLLFKVHLLVIPRL